MMLFYAQYRCLKSSMRLSLKMWQWSYLFKVTKGITYTINAFDLKSVSCMMHIWAKNFYKQFKSEWTLKLEQEQIFYPSICVTHFTRRLYVPHNSNNNNNKLGKASKSSRKLMFKMFYDILVPS